MKVYVVCEGTYEDIEAKAVFTDFEKAKTYCGDVELKEGIDRSWWNRKSEAVTAGWYHVYEMFLDPPPKEE